MVKLEEIVKVGSNYNLIFEFMDNEPFKDLFIKKCHEFTTT